MKTKNVTVSKDLATITNHVFFPANEGTTSTGKKLVYLVTDKRLSVPDFKKLMQDITLAEGYGFMKYYPEAKARYISATGIDAKTLQSLAAAYTWKDAEPKEAKKTAVKKTGKTTNAPKGQTETPAIDPELFAKFLAFQDMLKAGK